MTTKQYQEELWPELSIDSISDDIYIALAASIEDIAPENRHPCQWIGQQLWPDKNADTQYARAKACLDPKQKSTNFTITEIIYILKREDVIGIDHTYWQIASEVDRKIGEKVAPKSPKATILENISRLSAALGSAQRELDRLDAAAELQAVK